MIHRDIFTEIGLFDETLPACEDYDLWLRICAVYPVLYVEQPLIVKVGGHADQLSRHYWGMDRFRIQALEKILEAGVLGEQDHAAALETLLKKTKKTAVMIQGAVKRDNHALADIYRGKQHKHSRTHCMANTA
jgi:GT2 family glycosyltransferase